MFPMSPAQEMVVQDVRCFQGLQRGRLRPITLLVGENSTGKSTFLACYRIQAATLSHTGPGLAQPDFNEEPFRMGSFRDIVRSRRGPQGRIDEYRLGIAFESNHAKGRILELHTTFAEQGAQPTTSSIRWNFGAGEFLEARRGNDGQIIWRIPGYELPGPLPFDLVSVPTALASLTPHDRETDRIVAYIESRFGRSKEERWSFSDAMSPRLQDVVPIAPLRSEPRRTYDPVRETASSDGGHVPMLMMRLDRTDKPRWNALHDDLVAFGRESGLFSDLRVKRHGRQMSDPFQLRVKVRTGPSANIMDVGYGVSQSLPILVDIMAPAQSLPGPRTFLLQQPEVHLHPRGQAELASLFVQSFKKRRHQFLVETHSDYIVDRVRICVRKKLLRPDDVSILYFEPRGNAVTIHNMTLDKHGNLNDAPPGYRDFFAKETDRLLGFAD